MKNAIKAVYQAIEEQSAEKAQDALRAAIPVIDRTAAKADLHKKNVSRKVSRLTRRVNAFVADMQGSQAWFDFQGDSFYSLIQINWIYIMPDLLADK